jgi:hypothetical protein
VYVVSSIFLRGFDIVKCRRNGRRKGHRPFRRWRQDALSLCALEKKIKIQMLQMILPGCLVHSFLNYVFRQPTEENHKETMFNQNMSYNNYLIETGCSEFIFGVKRSLNFDTSQAVH